MTRHFNIKSTLQNKITSKYLDSLPKKLQATLLAKGESTKYYYEF